MKTFLGLLMCLLLNASLIPQIVKTYQTKCVKDLSFTACFIALLGFLVALVFCLLYNPGLFLAINYSLGFLFELALVIMIVIYKN